MVSGKFLANNGLEKRYEEWIANKPIAKFTGYVTELFIKTPEKKYQIDTLNAQFNGLIETAKRVQLLQQTLFLLLIPVVQ